MAQHQFNPICTGKLRLCNSLLLLFLYIFKLKLSGDIFGDYESPPFSQNFDGHSSAFSAYSYHITFIVITVIKNIWKRKLYSMYPVYKNSNIKIQLFMKDKFI